jgi:hypothetical protein
LAKVVRAENPENRADFPSKQMSSGQSTRRGRLSASTEGGSPLRAQIAVGWSVGAAVGVIVTVSGGRKQRPPQEVFAMTTR